MAKMNILDRSGHSEVVWARPVDKKKEDWTAEDQAAVDAAMETFNDMVRKGNRFVDRDNGRRVDTFDPNVNEYTMIPNVVGG